MAKKKASIDETAEQNAELFEEYIHPRLTAPEYWEWRSCIALLWLADEKLKNAEAELKLQRKEAELQQARMQLFSQVTVKARKTESDDQRKSYQELKQKLESRLGISMNGKVIDDVTFEVKTIAEDDVKDDQQKAGSA